MPINSRLFCALLLFITTYNANASPCTTFTAIPNPTPRSQHIEFIAHDASNDTCWTLNPEQVQNRHSPWSTFKIPHALIALESGVITQPNSPVAWDKVMYPAQDWWPNAWRQDHTLASAFQHSAVWYFKALTTQISSTQYSQWLKKFNYGNQKSSAQQQCFLAAIATANFAPGAANIFNRYCP